MCIRDRVIAAFVAERYVMSIKIINLNVSFDDKEVIKDLALELPDQGVVDVYKRQAVDGIQNIIDILEAVENGFLPDVEFLELNACNQGCVGGCLTIENPYAAKARLKRLMKFLPISRNKLLDEDVERVKACLLYTSLSVQLLFSRSSI